MARLLACLIGVVALSAAIPGHGDAAAAEAVQRSGAPEVAGATSGGKLRKLHLVRPDLIPFPLSFEVYC